MLPFGENAVVDVRKLTDYVLSPEHPRGRHKARVFAAALGLTAADAEQLRASLLSAARSQPAVPGAVDSFGRRYVVDYQWSIRTRSAVVRSIWILPTGESTPRLITCHVL